MLREPKLWKLLIALCTGAFAAGCASPDAPGDTENVEEAESALAPGCVTIMRGGAGDVFDTGLSAGNGGWAAGNSYGAWTGGNNMAAFQFDLSPVPANANVTSSTFDVYVSWNSDASPVEAHETNTAWTESTAKWSTLGGSAHYDAQVLGSFNPIWGANGRRTVSLTALTKAWLDGSKANNGIMLVQPTGSSHYFGTSEAGQADLRPTLTVCWDGEIDGDDCAANPCQNGGICTDGVNTYTCECPAGWTGTNCEVDVDECAVDDPCHIVAPAPGTNFPGGAACTNTPGSFTCECIPFAFGETCDMECPCVDEAALAGDIFTFLPWAYASIGVFPSLTCTTDSAGGTTIMTPFNGGDVTINYLRLDASSCSSRLSAPATYAMGSPEDHAACQMMIDNMIALNGLTCTLDNCGGAPCQNGGTCTGDANGYTCACTSGWTGTNCEVDVDECASGDPCNINSALGTGCTNTPGSFTCQCVDPIANSDCTACSNTLPAVCGDDLSNIGTGDFRIQFTVTTSQATQAALLSQRASCDYGMSWDIRLVDNHVFVETDDGSGTYSAVSSTLAVNDGNPHVVVVQRIAGVLTINIDCASQTSGPSTASFGALPALTYSSACVGNDATEPLDGTLTDVCVTH